MRIAEGKRLVFAVAMALLWFPAPSKILGQDPAPDQYHFHTILTSFSQAQGKSPLVNQQRNYGNCDAIATIKASMATFGIDHVVLEPTTLPEANSADSYQVRLRDGQSVTITHAELDTAINDLNLNSGFVPPRDGRGEPKITFKANFLYAVMAKNILSHPEIPLYSSIKSYQAALERLGNGINIEDHTKDQIGLLLGVQLKPANVATMLPSIPYVYALRKHVVFAYGTRGDLNGEDASLEDILKAHSTLFTRGLGANKHPDVYTVVPSGQ